MDATTVSTASIVNALSFDVEDYFHVAAFDAAIDRASWNDRPRRVDANTRGLLDLLSEAGTRATFYVLGWVAEREPDLVKAIAAAGHEVASHGYSHRLIYRQDPAEFREETRRSKALLEDLTGTPITSYRAASYSITAQSLWALDILYECGFRTDSSIFPIRHDLYGLAGGPIYPHRLQLDGGGELLEFPISTLKVAGLTLPVSGGGYFRLYPYALSRMLARRVNAQHRPFMFYLHPWEIDPEQPRIDAGAFSRFRHYNNLEKCRSRLVRLLQDFRFSTVSDSIARNYHVADLPVHSY
ncbi:MAG: DUF3473 domain-containing protein [Pseudomonadales bacterium]